MLEVNQILQQGRYRILEQNSQEGVGLSYQAYDNFLKANVALREINGNGDYAKRAQNLAQIKHETLLNIYDYFSEIDRQYLVLETVEADSIGSLIERNKSLCNLADFVKWSDQLLDAAVCLQNRIPSIIHGEIRPQNIKLATNNHLKLVTVSFNRQNERDPDSAELAFFPLERIWKNLDSTSKQFILRSFNEKSERLLEQSLDVRSDVYSIGATLYYLATGKHPFNALERTIEIVEGKIDPLKPLHQINPAIPPEIASIVMKALEIKREDRFSSALVMQSILRGTVFRLKPYIGAEVVAVLKANSPEVKPIEISKSEMPIEEPQCPKLIEDAYFKVEFPSFEPIKTGEEVAIAEKIETPADEIESEFNDVEFEADHLTETDELADIPEKKKGSFLLMVAFAVGLIVLGGIGWGIWMMNSSDPAPPSQSIPNQSVALPTETATPKVEVEATPVPISESSVAPTPETIPNAIPSEPMVTRKTVMKNKPTVSAAPVKKKPIVPKSAATPKTITVDDLINDN